MRWSSNPSCVHQRLGSTSHFGRANARIRKPSEIARGTGLNGDPLITLSSGNQAKTAANTKPNFRSDGTGSAMTRLISNLVAGRQVALDRPLDLGRAPISHLSSGPDVLSGRQLPHSSHRYNIVGVTNAQGAGIYNY
jgi:hypothetical protein